MSRVCVKGVPKTCNEDVLRKHFADFSSDITDVKVARTRCDVVSVNTPMCTVPMPYLPCDLALLRQACQHRYVYDLSPFKHLHDNYRADRLNYC